MSEQVSGNDSGQRRRADVHQIVANQNDDQHPRGVALECPQCLRARTAILSQTLRPSSGKRRERGLGTGKKSRKNKQYQKNNKVDHDGKPRLMEQRQAASATPRRTERIAHRSLAWHRQPVELQADSVLPKLSVPESNEGFASNQRSKRRCDIRNNDFMIVTVLLQPYYRQGPAEIRQPKPRPKGTPPKRSRPLAGWALAPVDVCPQLAQTPGCPVQKG